MLNIHAHCLEIGQDAGYNEPEIMLAPARLFVNRPRARQAHTKEHD
jgi:hypothetical protein